MNIKSKLTSGIGAAIAGAALAIAVPAVALPMASAATLHRVACDGRTDFLYVFSNSTTCWASPGTQAVNLYNVTSVRGGANSGYVQANGYGPDFFFANQTKFSVSNPHIVTVHINS